MNDKGGMCPFDRQVAARGVEIIMEHSGFFSLRSGDRFTPVPQFCVTLVLSLYSTTFRKQRKRLRKLLYNYNNSYCIAFKNYCIDICKRLTFNNPGARFLNLTAKLVVDFRLRIRHVTFFFGKFIFLIFHFSLTFRHFSFLISSTNQNQQPTSQPSPLLGCIS